MVLPQSLTRDRPNKEIYYLCLVDYIKFVLDETNSNWRTQKSTLVRLPLRNRLSDPSPTEAANHVHYFQSLAFRGKLFRAGLELQFAQREMQYGLDAWQSAREVGTISQMRSAASRLRSMLDDGLRVCQSLTTSGLAGSGDPYAGLFAAAGRWTEQFSADWSARDTEIQALPVDLDPLSEEVANAVMAFDECVFSAVSAFDVTTAATRTFESIHRKARLLADPSPIEE